MKNYYSIIILLLFRINMHGVWRRWKTRPAVKKKGSNRMVQLPFADHGEQSISTNLNLNIKNEIHMETDINCKKEPNANARIHFLCFFFRKNNNNKYFNAGKENFSREERRQLTSTNDKTRQDQKDQKTRPKTKKRKKKRTETRHVDIHTTTRSKENDKAKATPMDGTLDLVEQEIQRRRSFLVETSTVMKMPQGSLA